MQETLSVMDYFPYDAAREGQQEAIEFAAKSFEDGKRFVVIEAPTGAGKSVIAMTLARMYGTAYYLTIQKMLQDQLSNEFGENGRIDNFMTDLKGRNAYECTYNPNPKLNTKKQIEQWEKTKPHSCSDGHCKRRGYNFYEECEGLCPYYNQVAKAVSSNITLMNFAGFLHQTAFTKRFSARELLILDEGHNIESQLMNFISLSINDSEFGNLELPVLDNAYDYAQWIQDNDIDNLLNQNLATARINEDTKRVDELESTIRKLRHFLKEIDDGTNLWVHEYYDFKRQRSVTFKPVYINKYANSMLFGWAERVLIMSATILDVNVIARSLGIPKDAVAARRMKSRFPVENRPIHFKPAAKVTGGRNNMHAWADELVDAVNEIVREHQGQKGIVHTHNFYIAELLINDCDPDVSSRMLFQKNFINKSAMLKWHGSTDDSVLVAPAMHEGLDLIDDLSRFQIVCKVPFPNQFEDKQLAERMKMDPKYYEWLTALKLVQSIGRSIRSEDDWAETYIIDQSFQWWYRKNRKILPTWFREAVVT